MRRLKTELNKAGKHQREAEQHRIAEIRETEGQAEQHSKAERKKKVEQKCDRLKRVEQKFDRVNIGEHRQSVGGDGGLDFYKYVAGYAGQAIGLDVRPDARGCQG